MENLKCDRPHVLFLHRVCLRVRVWSHATHDQACLRYYNLPENKYSQVGSNSRILLKCLRKLRFYFLPIKVYLFRLYM